MATRTVIGGRGILIRFLLAVVVVFATFNPWGGSYYHFAIAPLFAPGGGLGTFGPLELLVGVLLAIGWVICIQATRRSLGLWGVLLLVVVFGAVIWLLIDQGLLEPRGSRALGTILLVVLSIILAIGMSWSHFSQRLTGQVDTDQVG
ncbi:MAG: DUF6524 family protein [Gemmatimonadales bacterium]